MNPLIVCLIIVFIVYWVESWLSCKRTDTIIRPSKKLYAWDGLLTVLPFIVLSVWTEIQWPWKGLIVLVAVSGSMLGIFCSGVLKK